MTDRDLFFLYLRQRAANIRALAAVPAAPIEAAFPASTTPEVLVLATAAIEALSKHWSRAWNRNIEPTAERIRVFLEEHADPNVWTRVALPPLRRYAARKREELLPLLDSLDMPRTSPGTERVFLSDPAWDSLLSTILQEIGAIAMLDDLDQFRYSRILYKQYRNPWVHALSGAGGRETLWQRRRLQDDEPRYENVMKGAASSPPSSTTPHSPHTRRVLVLPPLLLVRTLDEVIASMERSAVQLGIDPTVGLEEKDPWGLVR